MTERRRPLSPQNSRGVTLVELMIALLVIAIGVLALSAAQTRSSVDVYGTGRQTRALQLAQSRMETTRGVTFAAAVSDSGISDGFNWQTQVDTLGADMKTVRVVVSWTDHARPRSLRLDNLISDR